jgi:zinc transport system ATP-binding protein
VTPDRRTTNALLSCRALEVGHQGKAILPAIDLEVRAGDFWAVIGRNGSGKTTWLKTVLGLLPPVAGTVEPSRSDLRLSYLPQRSAMDELYPLLAQEVVGLGVLRGWSFLGPHFGRVSPRVASALAEMGVADLARRPFRQLSEGQKQRVLFARVAASDAEVAVLDEPTSAMDLVAEREAFRLIDELRRRHHTAIVIVSHYLGLVREFADSALLLDRDTPAVIVGKPEQVFGHQAFVARYGEKIPESRA